MYKGTRHTRATWSYKGNSAYSSAIGSEEECRALLAKCRDVFMSRRLLTELDFEQLATTKKTPTLTAVFGPRIRRARRTLTEKGVPERVTFALPTYLFIASKFEGLLARISRRERGEMPEELKDLHAYLKARAFDAAAGGTTAVNASVRTLVQVSKDGKRTPFTVTGPSIAERRRMQKAKAAAGSSARIPTSGESSTHRSSNVGQTALSLAWEAALSLQERNKT